MGIKNEKGMFNIKKPLLTVCGILALSTPLHVLAQGVQADYCWNKSYEAIESGDFESIRGYAFSLENDVIDWHGTLFDKKKNEDREYTQGTTVELYGDRSVNSFKLLNCPLDGFDFITDMIFMSDFKNRVSDSITIGLKAYTPDDLGKTGPIENDRPYASYVFFTDTKNREFADSKQSHRKYFKTALTLGTLNNNIARDYQSLVHEVDDKRNSRLPQGWHNKIKKQATLNYSVTLLHNWEFPLTEKNSIWKSNLFGFVGGDLGNVFRDIYVGGGFRIGGIISEHIVLPGISHLNSLNFSPPTNGKIFSDSKSCWVFYECYIFGSIGNKRVYENNLITGYSGNPVRCDDCILEPTVEFSSFGLTLQLSKHTTLSLAQYYSTKEFSAPTNPELNDAHYYGGIYLSFSSPVQ